jgi:hypothetical protein
VLVQPSPYQLKKTKQQQNKQTNIRFKCDHIYVSLIFSLYVKKNLATPLILAAQVGALDIVKLLLEKGSGVNDMDAVRFRVQSVHSCVIVVCVCV